MGIKDLEYFIKESKDIDSAVQVVGAYLNNKNTLIDLLKKESKKLRDENEFLKEQLDYYKSRYASMEYAKNKTKY